MEASFFLQFMRIGGTRGLSCAAAQSERFNHQDFIGVAAVRVFHCVRK